MNKLLSLVLALALLLGVFSLGAQAENEQMVIEWLGGHDTDPISEGDTVLAWLEEKFDVKLNVWFIERSNAAELLATRWAADEVPDVFWLETTELFVKAVDQGVCLEMPLETVQELLPNSYQWLIEFDPDCFDMVSVGGKNYGLPRVNLDSKYPYAPFWRADWLEEYGYERGEVPRTIDEFEDVFYFFGQGDPDGNGIDGDTYAISNTGFLPIFGAFGALPDRWIVNDEGNLEYGAVYAGMKDALELLAKWYADGLVDPEFVTGENQGGHWSLSIPFENGTLGFSSSGAFYQLEPDFDGPKNEETGEGGDFSLGKTMRNLSFPYEDVAIGYNPIGPDGKNGGVQWTLTTSEAVCFSYKLANDPEKLAKICEIIDTIGSDYDTWVRIWNWDLNDDAYTYDELFGFMTEPGYKRVDDNSHTNMFNTLQNPYFKMTADPARYNWVNSMDQFAQHGYTDQLKTVTASNPQYWTALESYRQGTYVQFIRGEKSLDEWDDFVATWYSMGGDIITEEANEWYHSK